MNRVAPESAIGNLAACVARLDYGRALKRELLMQNDPDAGLATPLLDAVSLFELLKIGYALAGGVAAMFYGRARFTEDVDFIAASGHQDILAANPEIMRRFHFDPGCTWKLYHERGTDVDIWKDQFCDQMISRAIASTISGRAVRIVEMHDLIAMKLRAGRLQDDFDISEIAKHQQLDLDRLHFLITADEFIRFQQILARS